MLLDEVRLSLCDLMSSDELLRQVVARVGKDFAKFKKHLAAQRRAIEHEESHGFEKQFKSDPDVPHHRKGFLQKVFQVPYRPEDVKTLQCLVSWLERRLAPWPLLAIASGNHNIALGALQAAAKVCDGDTSYLYTLVDAAEHQMKKVFVESKLCNSLMREDDLWQASKLDAIFAAELGTFPDPVLSTDVYGKSLWAATYSKRAFISVDIREANYNVLRIMASLVDPDLSSKLKPSWQAMLEDIVSKPAADALKRCKQYRQRVLGGLHVDWIDSQKSILSKDEYKHLCSQREQFAKSERGISKVSKEIQQLIMRHVAAAVWKRCELCIFAFLGDEVKFILPEGCSVSDVDKLATTVHDALPHVFTESFSSLQNMFRVDAELILDLSKHYQDCDHGTYAVLCRRVNRTAGPDLSVQLKGVRGSNRFLEPPELEQLGEGVKRLHQENLAEWNAWYGQIAAACSP
jgi:hypothetical protein